MHFRTAQLSPCLPHGERNDPGIRERDGFVGRERKDLNLNSNSAARWGLGLPVALTEPPSSNQRFAHCLRPPTGTPEAVARGLLAAVGLAHGLDAPGL